MQADGYYNDIDRLVDIDILESLTEYLLELKAERKQIKKEEQESAIYDLETERLFEAREARILRKAAY